MSTPSTAARPDLDWSQIRETILMLNLAIAQMEMAMRDSGDSVGVLSEAFTSIYGKLSGMDEAVRRLPDSPERTDVLAMSDGVAGDMQNAIMAFQFYDRLSQRLAHVAHSLSELTAIVADTSRLYNPNAWLSLQDLIRSKYTMEDEKLMFDTLLRTGNVAEALEQFVANRQQEAGDASDVELF
jgi:hypothetical protein